MKLSLRFAIFLKALTFSLSIYIFCCISQLFCFIFFAVTETFSHVFSHRFFSSFKQHLKWSCLSSGQAWMFKDKVECSSLVAAVASPHSIPYRITTLVTSNSSNTTLSTTTVGMRQAKTTRCRYTLKMALFNPQKQQFSIFKNGSLKSSKTAVFNYQKWHLKNISGRKKTSSRSCKNTSFSLLTNADEKLNISCKNVVIE